MGQGAVRGYNILSISSCIILDISDSSQHCVMGFLKNESLQVIVDAPRDSRIFNSFNFVAIGAQSMPINEPGLLVKFFIAAKFNHSMSSG